jgi:orotate phosphoribosyltransferase
VGDDLVRRMLEVSELHGDFELSSGARSGVYLDKFLFLTRPDLLREIAAAVAERLPAGVTILGAPEGAAMLLVAAVSLQTGLPVVVVRKEPKAYGTRQQVEGAIEKDARVVLLEDVSTTGHQVRAAAETLQAAGATIERIILVIDRGGGEHLREAGYEVDAVAEVRPDEV